MRKFFTLVAVLVVGITMVSAQTFRKGSQIVSANVGFGGYGIPITLNYEHGIYDINEDMSIGVGGMFGFATKSEGIIQTTGLSLAAQGVYHYTGFDKFDLYASLDLGWNIATAKTKASSGMPAISANAGGFLWGINLGARYYFTDNFAVKADLGYGLSYISVGVSYKF